jgi:hypothetical protein
MGQRRVLHEGKQLNGSLLAGMMKHPIERFSPIWISRQGSKFRPCTPRVLESGSAELDLNGHHTCGAYKQFSWVHFKLNAFINSVYNSRLAIKSNPPGD